MKRPEPQCPIRPGDPCSLCYPGADGPENCGLVWLVNEDPDLQEILVEKRREAAARRRAEREARERAS